MLTRKGKGLLMLSRKEVINSDIEKHSARTAGTPALVKVYEPLQMIGRILSENTVSKQYVPYDASFHRRSI